MGNETYRLRANPKAVSVKLYIMIALGAALSSAEVVDSAAGGFTVKITHQIKSAPDDVYHRLLNVGEWWNSAHTFSGDAHNLRIEDHLGGCFCEKLPNNGFVRHLEVVSAAPGH